jgi:predicted MFS family arabinose efflux permease
MFTIAREGLLSSRLIGPPVLAIDTQPMSQVTRQLSGSIGYPWTIRVFAFIILFNSAVIIALARPRQADKVAGNGDESDNNRRAWTDMVSAFKDGVFVTYIIGVFLALLGVYGAFFYMATYGRAVIGLSESDSLTIVLVFNAVGIPGRLMLGYVADRFYGPFSTVLPFTLGGGILLLAWMAVDSTAAYYVFVVMFGICTHAFNTLLGPTLATFVTDSRQSGQRMGIGFGVAGLAGLTSPPLAGALIALGGGSYVYLQIYSGALVSLGFVVLTSLRLWQIRQARDL